MTCDYIIDFIQLKILNYPIFTLISPIMILQIDMSPILDHLDITFIVQFSVCIVTLISMDI